MYHVYVSDNNSLTFKQHRLVIGIGFAGALYYNIIIFKLKEGEWRQEKNRKQLRILVIPDIEEDPKIIHRLASK